MTKTLSLDEAAKQAEAALKARRKPNYSNDPTPSDKPIGIDMSAIRGMVAGMVRSRVDEEMDDVADKLDDIIAGVELETAAKLDAQSKVIAKLRTEVGATKKTVVEITQSGKRIGKVEGLSHRQLPQLVKATSIRDAWGNRKNIALVGPMGAGKSTAGNQMSKAFNLPFYYLGQTIMPHDVIGSVNQVSDKFRSTPFVRAYTEGGIVMLEEMDSWSPQATLVTNVPLANGYIELPDGTQHKRHPDCIIIACMNTWGQGATAEYVGRNKLDAAYMDRFICINWQYDDDLERNAANDDEVVDFVQLCRHNAEKAGIKVAISPRASIDIADMVRGGFSIAEAAEMKFLGALPRNERKIVLDSTDIT